MPERHAAAAGTGRAVRRAVRLDPALIVAFGLALGGAMSESPVACGLGVVAAMALIRPHVTLPTLLVATAALAVGTWRARMAVTDFEARRVQARDTIEGPRRCAGAGVVASSPTWRKGAASLELELDELDCEGRRFSPPIRVRVYGGPGHLGRGDAVLVVADLAPVELYHNLGLPDPTPLAARRGVVLSGGAIAVEATRRGWGIGALIDRARAHARERILRTFAPVAEPLARALVLGENDLDPQDDAAFKLSGLAHLLAVSGTHLVLAVVGLVEILRVLLFRLSWLARSHDLGRWAAAFGGGLALVYADFAGGSGSAWRAAWMLATAFAARALGRHASVSRSFASSLMIGAIADPLLVFDVSFLLSAAATAGLVVLGQPIARVFGPLRFAPLRFLCQSVGVTVSAMLPCVPLLALLSPSVTGAGVLANVIAGPLGEMVALPLCLLHALVAWAPALERGIALVGSGALLLVRELALWGSRAQWLSFSMPPPGAYQLAVLLVGCLAGVLLAFGGSPSPLRRWVTVAVALGAMIGSEVLLEQASRAAAQPRDRLRITALDVGQGDATLVDLPDGRLMLIDGGGSVGGPDPGKLVILPLLRQQRRTRLDIAVLTHAHPDHLQGLVTVLSAMQVGELWMPWHPSRAPHDPVLGRLLHELALRGVPIRSAAELCQGPRLLADAQAWVLSPCDPGAESEPGNDGSLVMKLTLGERAALLPGDAEAPRERDLVRRWGSALRADLLKVGHHGSRTSTTTTWLGSVAPRFATIACGVRNPHGHPNPATVERLVRHGVRAFRLDRNGSVEWSTDGHSVAVRAYSPAGR